MPARDTFKSATGYYSTLLHELTHWTGHETRCKRDLENSFGSEKYAREELVAECGAALLCMSLGVEKQPTPEHAKYLNSWMQAIKDDYKAIYSAMSQAQKAVDYLEGLQAEQTIAAE
jgi:antirestriction protein ArdC